MTSASARRGFLGGLVTAPIALGMSEARANPCDPAEAAFLRWLDLVGAGNAATADTTRVEWSVIEAAEDEFLGALPSPAKAVALALHEIVYLGSEVSIDSTVSSLLTGAVEEVRVHFRLLSCLRSFGSGRVAQFASDLLDHPERPLTRSVLARAYAGEVVS